VARNWRCRRGELDIIGFDEGVLVVVEVRTRSGLSSDDALYSIDGVKRARLRRLARQFISLELGLTDDSVPIRLDVIGLAMEHGIVLQLAHIRGAVDDDG
jgi:putative endonuclease